MNNDTENILSQRTIQEIIIVANEFCHLIETVETQSQEIFIHVMQKIMPLLYLKGSLIPEITVSNPDANLHFVTEDDWNKIFQMVKEKLGKKDVFLFRSEDDLSAKVETFSIAEDITDIYQDMKDCLKLLQLNTQDAQENAIFELRQLFFNHWGIRVCRVQYALHELMFR